MVKNPTLLKSFIIIKIINANKIAAIDNTAREISCEGKSIAARTKRKQKEFNYCSLCNKCVVCAIFAIAHSNLNIVVRLDVNRIKQNLEIMSRKVYQTKCNSNEVFWFCHSRDTTHQRTTDRKCEIAKLNGKAYQHSKFVCTYRLA